MVGTVQYSLLPVVWLCWKRNALASLSITPLLGGAKVESQHTREDCVLTFLCFNSENFASPSRRLGLHSFSFVKHISTSMSDHHKRGPEEAGWIVFAWQSRFRRLYNKVEDGGQLWDVNCGSWCLVYDPIDCGASQEWWTPSTTCRTNCFQTQGNLRLDGRTGCSIIN